MKSMGGKFSTPNESSLVYDNKIRDTYNHKGMISSLDCSVFERTIGLLSEMGVKK